MRGRSLLALLALAIGPAISQGQTLAATKRQIVARMLVNLAGIYGRNGDLPRSLDVLERLAIIEPSNPRIARDLTQLRGRVDNLN